MTRIIPNLWYTKDAEEAARFYASVIPDSRVDRVSTVRADSPSGPEGAVPVVEFTLAAQPFMAISAGPLDPFNHAISLMVLCDSQEEIDILWEALSEGGAEERCGWLRDRYGVAWQIAPRRLQDWMADPDEAAARRTAAAMLSMVRFDIAALEAAHAGRAGG